MSFKDLSQASMPPRVDTTAQGEARAQAAADLKAKADAKAARAAAKREGKRQQHAAKASPVAKEKKGGPTHA